MQPSNKFNELGEKPVGRLLMQYAIPAIIAMTASSLYHIIDGIFIGQGVGPEAIMGLALTGPLMSLTAAFGAMVGVGGATLMSVKLGQKDYETARDILGNVVIMNVVMGLVLGGVLLAGLDGILRFFGASDVTIQPARDFMTVILVGNVVTHLYLGLNALLRSTNRPRQAMYATFGTVLLNCVLAPIFIFVLDWGIRGAATATILAQCIMLGWEIHLFMRPSEPIRLERERVRVKVNIMKESLVIGAPNFLINLCACMVAIFVTRSMTTYGGDVAVGAFGVVNRLAIFIVMVVIGLNQGMQPIAGYNYGARQYGRIIEVLKLSVIIATVITTFGFIVGTFFPVPCVEVFAKDSPELIEAAAHGLSIYVMFFPFIGMQIVSTAFFQSIGHAGKSIVLSLTRQLIFLLPAILIIPMFVDNKVDGVWYAMPFSDAMATLISVALLLKQVRTLRGMGETATTSSITEKS
jgi:putative MATE family efflux protein